MVAEPLPGRRDLLAALYSVQASDDSVLVARQADIIILAIKPQMAAAVLASLAPAITADKLVISFMAGISTAFIEEAAGGDARVVRAMPNTPALIQAAATAICPGSRADQSDLDTARFIFNLCGTVVNVPEKLMDAVTGLSGSGPAYVFSFIEALSDAGVKNGLPREIALQLSLQTVLGAARMLAETGEHPALLKEKVTSPGGTTIAGLHTLENGRFHGLIMDAVDSASLRSKELSGK
jgi:pyrroline-5-carboxylate reductase